MTREQDAEDWELQSVRLTPASAGTASLPSSSCHAHPDRVGAFRCAGCGRLLCEECAPDKLMSGELVRFCGICGGVCTEVEADEPAEAGHPNPGASAGARARRPLPPPPLPEPPPTDRQLFSILVQPFRGWGALWLLAWWWVNFFAWPLGLLWFVPYLWALYLSVERVRPRIPAPWGLGGGAWLVAGRWMKLLISPGLLIALCYALLSGGQVRVPPRQPGTLIVSTGALAAIGVVLMWVLAILLPLMLTVLFRLGSPFKSMDPLVLLTLIRRSPSRYIACLVSIIVLGGFALGLYLVLSRIPVPPGIPGLGFVARPGPALTLAGVLALVWAITALGRYGRWVSWCLDEDEE